MNKQEQIQSIRKSNNEFLTTFRQNNRYKFISGFLLNWDEIPIPSSDDDRLRLENDLFVQDSVPIARDKVMSCKGGLWVRYISRSFYEIYPIQGGLVHKKLV